MRPSGRLLALTLAACSRSSAPAPALALAPAPASASALAPAPAPSSPCPSLADRIADVRSGSPDAQRTVVDGAFLFVDADHGPLFASELDLTARALYALRNGRIAARPLCPVTVFVFSSLDHFKKHCGDRGLVPPSGRNVAVYDPVHGQIVTDLSGGRDYLPSLAHELAHRLMDADWGSAAPGPEAPDAAPPRNAPLWFRECVASLYEAPSFPTPGEIHGTDNWRYVQLRAAVRAHDREAHLGALFGMTDAAFRGTIEGGGTDGTRSLLHRAMARATCQWLDAEGQLWPLYRAWRDGRETDPEGVAAFTRITGHAPTDREEEDAWRTWVLRTR